MELSNYELVHAICDICENIYGGNPRGLITYVEDRKGHDLRYAIDPYKLKRELGWEPQHGSYAGLIEGLTETIKWYMSTK
jgi:dTDP-glucose 4,6-dehydratase